MLFCGLLILSKSSFLKNSFRNTIRVSNSLDPDEAQHFVECDLGPNCLQTLSADDTGKQSKLLVSCQFSDAISLVVWIYYLDENV